MKNYYFIIVALTVSLFVSCGKQTTQTDENATDSASVSIAQTPEARSMDLAVRMARYGYENESAEVLVAAANIMLNYQTEKLDVTPQKEGGETPAEAAEAKSLDPASLLADARSFAGDDELLSRMIERAEQRMAASDPQSTRGSESASGYVTEYIYPHQSDVYTIHFTVNRKAAVTVLGDGSTDLNLYIYDANGNPITNDMGPTDQCRCEWTPSRSGNHIIKIINRGNDNNEYTVFIEK